jgi:hypothetical protein
MATTPNHYSCAICGATPAAYLVASSAAARFLWWNRQYFAQPACAICAEQIYIAAQKRNGRQGWWGLISFFYTAFSLVRNKLSIEAHRKSIPYVVHEGEVYSRPKLQIRTDTPTVIATIGFVLLIAYIAVYSVEASKPVPRNSQGQVTAQAQADWKELKLGDCVTTAGQGSDIKSLEVTACKTDHSWQVFGMGTLTGNEFGIGNPADNVFNEKAISKEAKRICDKATKAIDSKLTSQLNVDLSTLTYLPTEASWTNGDYGVTCLVGNEGYNFGYSFLK